MDSEDKPKILKLVASNPARPRVRGCMNCAFRTDFYKLGPEFWRCGRNSNSCSRETRAGGDCGPSMANWQPRPPTLWQLVRNRIADWLAVKE